MSDKISFGAGAAGPKKKNRRGLKFLLLLCLLLAGGGAWATYQYVRTGEVLIPLPEEAAKFIGDNLIPGGRLGPVRFGDYPDAGTPAEQAGQAEQTGQGAPAGSTEPAASSAASGANGAASAPALPAAAPAKGGEAAAPARPAPPQPTGGNLVTPPDAGWRGEAAIQSEEIREAGPAGPGRAARPAGRRDAALFESPGAPGGRADGGSSLSVPFDSAAAKNPAALMPVGLSEDAGQARVKVYSGEDSVVSLDFVGDLAAYLGAGYWPAGTHPLARGKAISTVSLRSLNQRYGIDLHGFRTGGGAVRDYSRDREVVLNYVFMPSMIQALTNLYLDRFADALAGLETVTDARGDSRKLTRTQRVGMLEHYAADCRALSDAVNAYRSAPNGAALVNAFLRSEQETQSAAARLLDAKQALETATAGQDQAAAREAAKDVNRLETAYGRSLERQRQAEAAVRSMMNKGSSARLGGEDLLYAACWLNRRAADDETLKAAASGLSFAARGLGERAKKLRNE